MRRYLLDTDAIVDFSRDREPVASRILEMIDGGDEIGVCAVVVAEFYSGLLPQERTRWQSFFDALRFWDETREVAEQAGIWRYEYARKGVTLSTTDLLIAAVANDIGAVLVTNNIRDFPLEEIKLLSIRDQK